MSFFRFFVRSLFLFLCMSLLIQKTFSQSFNAGMQGGMSATQVTGDGLGGFDKPGLFAGFMVNYPISDRADIQLEMNFIQKGSRGNAKPTAGNYDSYLLRLNYVELPLMVRFELKKPLRIELGLQFAYLINAREFDLYGEVSPDPSIPYFHDLDFSGFGGLNYQIKDHWAISLRYAYSIIAIRPKPTTVTYRYDGGLFNEVLCTSVQYLF